eukprot:461596_1
MASQCPTFVLVLSISFIYQLIHGSIINCDGTESCRYNTLTCNTSEDCNIQCKGSSSCRDSTIICPTHGNCTIDCASGYANVCQNTTIKAINSTYLTLNCPANLNFLNTYGCDKASIYCPNNGHSGP